MPFLSRAGHGKRFTSKNGFRGKRERETEERGYGVTGLVVLLAFCIFKQFFFSEAFFILRRRKQELRVRSSSLFLSPCLFYWSLGNTLLIDRLLEGGRSFVLCVSLLFDDDLCFVSLPYSASPSPPRARCDDRRSRLKVELGGCKGGIRLYRTHAYLQLFLELSSMFSLVSLDGLIHPRFFTYLPALPACITVVTWIWIA
ncbi:hypothetical protein B0T19DRAFT_187866 [Cercophora scortea]|uniref:Uncharacterized protein n=1 Tax=Cercophora scortea TaxID=314031 RepID=A0AAE0INP8_9PEZI|nr:hypothetical protein B0T19DRAFT_187866 [Cercophora scortea]